MCRRGGTGGKPAKVLDLMEALQASLDAAKKGGGGKVAAEMEKVADKLAAAADDDDGDADGSGSDAGATPKRTSRRAPAKKAGSTRRAGQKRAPAKAPARSRRKTA